GWATLIAFAGADEFARLVHKQFMRAEKRLGKAYAAGVSVEEVQVRLEEFFCVRTDRFFHARRGESLDGSSIGRPLADCGSQVATVAHQQQRGHGFQSVQ